MKSHFLKGLLSACALFVLMLVSSNVSAQNFVTRQVAMDRLQSEMVRAQKLGLQQGTSTTVPQNQSLVSYMTNVYYKGVYQKLKSENLTVANAVSEIHSKYTASGQSSNNRSSAIQSAHQNVITLLSN